VEHGIISGEVFLNRGWKATKTLVIWLSVEQKGKPFQNEMSTFDQCSD
jgi:hypothetical protein